MNTESLFHHLEGKWPESDPIPQHVSRLLRKDLDKEKQKMVDRVRLILSERERQEQETWAKVYHYWNSQL